MQPFNTSITIYSYDSTKEEFVAEIPTLQVMRSFHFVKRLNDVDSWTATLELNLALAKDRKILDVLENPDLFIAWDISYQDNITIELLTPDIANGWSWLANTEINMLGGDAVSATLSGRSMAELLQQTAHSSGNFQGYIWDKSIFDSLLSENATTYIGGTAETNLYKTAVGRALEFAGDSLFDENNNRDYTIAPYLDKAEMGVAAGNHSLLTSLQRAAAASAAYFRVVKYYYFDIFIPENPTITFSAGSLLANIKLKTPEANVINISRGSHTDTFFNSASVLKYGVRQKNLPAIAPSGVDETLRAKITQAQGQLEILENYGEDNGNITLDIEVPWIEGQRFGESHDWKLGDIVGVYIDDSLNWIGTNSLLVSEVAMTIDRNFGYSIRAGLGWKPKLIPKIAGDNEIPAGISDITIQNE